VLLARGSSHRTTTDAEMIRWGSPFARVEGRRHGAGEAAEIDVTLARDGAAGGRKKVRVNGVARRASYLPRAMRAVIFAPEELQLVVGPPSLRRSALDALASQRMPGYGADLATYGRALLQRNHLLRAIREERAQRAQLAFWDGRLVEAGTAILEARHLLLAEIAPPLAAAHAEIAPGEGVLRLSYVTNAAPGAGESFGSALARRLAETAEKELWNGTTLVGPHRDDVGFELDGRDMASSASRGQQRTAILALKLAELDLLAALDGQPPLLLLDDVFSELDPARRAHLVRRVAALPQVFMTAVSLVDLDPALRATATAWQVAAEAGRARLVEGGS
jgi:DNA replication and repair protein RecF